MAKKSQWTDKDANTGRSSANPGSAVGKAVRPDSDEVLLAAQAPHTSATETLRRFAALDEGWLRIVSHEEGLSVYYKYKWSRGKFAGKYVMWWDQEGTPAAALFGLLQKVEGVYAGTVRPTVDTPYD